MKTSTHTYDWRSEFKRLDGAYAQSTMKSYVKDVEIFVDWCAAKGLEALPADVDTVCRFLEGQAPGLAPSTVRRRLYAIRKIHRLLRLPDPTHDEDINIALRRARRAKLTRPKQAKGLTREYLEKFLAAEPDTPTGWRNRALLSLGYDLLTRRAELVALRTEDLAWRADGTLRVLIRRSKADPFGEGRIAFTSTRTRALIDDWLQWRGQNIPWLFCPIYHGKALARPLGTTTVRDIIKQAARNAELDDYVAKDFSGHSLRVGAAQDLLTMGQDTAAIMRAGGWKSVNVLGRYLESAEHNVWV
ncbi:tyrosine-type recombinase/integrase [Ovoidimarina sediminis]|uniref:tyrosine-type recombinase/integrase n=1 Tax=Ovoidimarina sediminis TaxID=3079856 RepID=UPI00290AD29A|nr:tyrosine-type recombinase/integrase [Rhodophyticola sp. MJ-SS7]MDU8946137.1 tyrosine-type recombinase/integrase [Rhodophyticola sp. MJ-SS7]